MTVSLVRQPLPETRADVAFGALLRVQRMLSGLTQEELAEHSGLSVREIRDLEIGRAERPQQQTVELLATALGLDARERTDLCAPLGLPETAVQDGVERLANADPLGVTGPSYRMDPLVRRHFLAPPAGR